MGMTEADRIVKQQIADRRAAEINESRSQAQQQARDRATLHREIHNLIAEIVPLAKQLGYPDIEPVIVVKYRFPPFGDLFGYWKSVKGGWALGTYGAQSLSLLADGRVCWEGRPSRLQDIDWCVSVVRNGLRKLRTHLDSYDGQPWRPGGVTIG